MFSNECNAVVARAQRGKMVNAVNKMHLLSIKRENLKIKSLLKMRYNWFDLTQFLLLELLMRKRRASAAHGILYSVRHELFPKVSRAKNTRCFDGNSSWRILPFERANRPSAERTPIGRRSARSRIWSRAPRTASSAEVIPLSKRVIIPKLRINICEQYLRIIFATFNWILSFGINKKHFWQ